MKKRIQGMIPRAPPVASEERTKSNVSRTNFYRTTTEQNQIVQIFSDHKGRTVFLENLLRGIYRERASATLAVYVSF